jgi:hypothetical protein
MGQKMATTRLGGEAFTIKQVVELHHNYFSKPGSNGVPKVLDQVSKNQLQQCLK